MPTYFFSETEDGSDISPQEKGFEFGSLEEACEEAERTVRAMAIEVPFEQKTILMRVLDADRRVLHTVTLSVDDNSCGN